MAAIIQPNQCNCRNCRYVEKQRSNILRAVRPVGKGISDDMVAIWNDALENYPCQFAVRPTFTKTETVFVDVHQVADSLPVTYATVQAMLVGPVEHIKLTIVVGGTNSDH